ncbi:hypothetical protein ASPACDRAFT_10359, partial [Aspergillus aculeatus ATCC 16872]
ISLVDKTAPRRPSDDALAQSHTATTDLSRNISRKFTRASIRSELAKRKYAKWQPDRLGLTDDEDTSDRRLSEGRDLFTTETRTDTLAGESRLTAGPSSSQSSPEDQHNVDSSDVDQQAARDHEHDGQNHPKLSGLKPGTELEILYENQRGWFFFGIPLYSHSSLLNFDPAAWTTPDGRDSAVDITKAQLPDPSWEWVWKTWYVDMSGDVDDQGWQYSFSFGSSAWHGSHPWYHSYVRRRRWVRLRVKRVSERSRRGRSGLEVAHMLNEDYFTIHSGKAKTRASSTDGLSRATSGYLSRAATKVEEEVPVEEIANIPALMHALRVARVDREKMDALEQFMQEGEDELFYLDGKIPEIMSMFVFQASRWQYFTRLSDVVEELSQSSSEASGKEAAELQRKRDHFQKAADVARRHLTGPEVLHSDDRHLEAGMLDLTPAPKRGSLLSKYSGKVSFRPMDDGGEIKGIPQAAEVGREGHIYHLYFFSCPCYSSFVRMKAECWRRRAQNLGPFTDRLGRENISRVGPYGLSSMLSRSRPYLTRRRLPAVLDHVATAPDEPLLFLYPSWFTSLPAHRGSSLTRNPALSLSRQYHRPSKRGPSVPRLSPQSSTGNYSSRQITSSSIAVGRRGLDKEATKPAAKPQASRTSPLPQPTSDNTSRWTPPRVRSLAALSSISPRDKKKLQHRQSELDNTRKNQQKTIERRWKDQAAVYERMLRMNRAIPAHAPLKSNQLELYLREETIAEFAGLVSRGENIFYRHVYHGCKVHVKPLSESVGMCRRVILEGRPAAVEEVKKELLEIGTLQDEYDPVVDMRKPVVPIYPRVDRRIHKDIPLVRGTWDMPKDPTEFTVDQIVRQGELLATVRDFTHHVEDLITSWPNSREQPGKHGADVADALETLFLKSAHTELISTASLNQALSFLLERKQYWIAHQIFHSAKHVATVETFNMMLKSTALEQNLKRFRNLLHGMENLGIRADVETWLAFADCFVSPTKKMAVVNSLRQRGMLQKTTLQRTALRAVLHDLLVEHLHDGGDMNSFLEKIARDWDSTMWSPSMVNQMMCAVMRVNHLKARDQLFQFCRQNGLRIEPYTFYLLVGTCNKGNILQALQYMYQTMEDPARELNVTGWTRLFLHAWHGGYYNICRVLWRYACMRGHAASRIAERVYESLLHEAGPDTTFRRAVAARLILGIDLGTPRPTSGGRFYRLKGLPAEYAADPVKYLCIQVDPTERNNQLNVSEAILARDMDVGRFYKPQVSLRAMLDAATIVDLEWKELAR